MRIVLAGLSVVFLTSTAVFAQSAEAGGVASSMVARAAARDTFLSAGAAAAPAASLSADAVQDDSQAAYDAARGRRSTGKKLMLIGGGAIAGGLVLAYRAENEFNDCFNSGGAESGGVCKLDARLGAAVAYGGAGLLGFGLYRFIEAGRDMRRIEARRAAQAGGSVFVVPFTDNSALVASVGRRSTLGGRVSW